MLTNTQHVISQCINGSGTSVRSCLFLCFFYGLASLISLCAEKRYSVFLWASSTTRNAAQTFCSIRAARRQSNNFVIVCVRHTKSRNRTKAYIAFGLDAVASRNQIDVLYMSGKLCNIQNGRGSGEVILWGGGFRKARVYECLVRSHSRRARFLNQQTMLLNESRTRAAWCIEMREIWRSAWLVVFF